jgi:hypothetical protein
LGRIAREIICQIDECPFGLNIEKNYIIVTVINNDHYRKQTVCEFSSLNDQSRFKPPCAQLMINIMKYSGVIDQFSKIEVILFILGFKHFLEYFN